MPDADYDARLARLEAQVDTLTRALHLTLVSAQPTSKWLDAKMAEIDAAIPAEHRLIGTGCACGKWKAGLGESITRGFDLHVLDRRCDWCGGPIPTTKRVDAETCSDRCAKDRQRARVTPPAEPIGTIHDGDLQVHVLPPEVSR